MTLKFFLFLFLTCGIYVSESAQITLTGIVNAENSKTVLPFVNIGIRHKSVGTISLADGTFSIKIPTQNENDTLTFSMVGYEQLNMPVKNMIAGGQKIVHLKEKQAELSPVTITGRKLVERKFGIKNDRSLIHFTDGSTNQNDIFEIAQLIKLDTILSKITSVNLYVNQLRSDSGTFRINFYGFDGNKPTERIIEKNIVQKKRIREGWLKFDLYEYGIYLKGSFVVAIEFIPAKKNNDPVYYEIKIGGSSKSFSRANSQGEWSIPPHHYRLFITALVADEKNKNWDNDGEEKETLPAVSMFSRSVQDSFSIFVYLPKDYAKKKGRKFPIIYLLDANVYFDHVANLIEERNIKAILVGIGYKDFLHMDSLRSRDYLYPKTAFSEGLPISGGANEFLKFIMTELAPYINQTYPADTVNQTLMGHSFGGYFVLYALLEAMQHNDATFKNYVAASPSLDYSHKYLLEQFQSLPGKSTNPKNLFVTYGAKEDSEDGGTGTEGLDNFNLLVALLSGKEHIKIQLKNKVYPAFGHMETAVPTFIQSVQDINDNRTGEKNDR